MFHFPKTSIMYIRNLSFKLDYFIQLFTRTIFCFTWYPNHFYPLYIKSYLCIIAGFQKYVVVTFLINCFIGYLLNIRDIFSSKNGASIVQTKEYSIEFLKLLTRRDFRRKGTGADPFSSLTSDTKFYAIS